MPATSRLLKNSAWNKFWEGHDFSRAAKSSDGKECSRVPHVSRFSKRGIPRSSVSSEFSDDKGTLGCAMQSRTPVTDRCSTLKFLTRDYRNNCYVYNLRLSGRHNKSTELPATLPRIHPHGEVCLIASF